MLQTVHLISRHNFLDPHGFAAGFHCRSRLLPAPSSRSVKPAVGLVLEVRLNYPLSLMQNLQGILFTLNVALTATVMNYRRMIQ
jgi:hypothetical protein